MRAVSQRVRDDGVVDVREQGQVGLERGSVRETAQKRLLVTKIPRSRGNSARSGLLAADA
jgi:hypothetical protein